jgi:predicted nucleic acid-binding protein
MNPSVVVDTNILFAALVASRSRIREFLFTEKEVDFSCPRFLFVELFKHKERIVAATELSEDELLDVLNAMLARVRFVEEAVIPIGIWLEARRLCHDIDEKDTPFIALTIHPNARLWTEDAELKVGLRAKGFNLFLEP